MELLHMLIMALVQGLTEFLPISSTAHLILIPALFGMPAHQLSWDIAVHAGTLCAMVVYFRHDLQRMAAATTATLTGKGVSTQARLAFQVGLATVPVGLCGLFGKSFIEQHLRSPWVIAITTLVFGILLGIACQLSKNHRDTGSLSFRDTLAIGCAQALALIPGASRSGVTLTAGLLLGLNPQSAARFAFLMAIPVITLACGLSTAQLLAQPETVDWGLLGVGFVTAAISGFACIKLFMIALQRIGLLPFVIYRLVLAGVLFWYLA